MHERGIGVGVHYQALHLFTPSARLGYRAGEFPNAERIGARTRDAAAASRSMSDADVDASARRSSDLMRQPAMTGAAAPELSVVIPVYNEEAGLPALFARLYPALDALGRSYEVVLRRRRQPRPLRGAPARAVRPRGPT